MSLPEAFQDTLTAWLDARLEERFARQQRVVLEGVVEMVTAMLNEQIRRDAEAQKQELEQLGADIKASFDRIEGVLEQQQQRLDRAARGEPLDRTH